MYVHIGAHAAPFPAACADRSSIARVCSPQPQSTAMTSGGTRPSRTRPPRIPTLPGSMRAIAGKVRTEGPVLRSDPRDSEGERMPEAQFFQESNLLQRFPPRGTEPKIFGRESSFPLSEADKYRRRKSLEREAEEDSALMETEPGEDDEEAAAWREAEGDARNSDISVSMDYEPDEIDPEAIAAAQANLDARAAASTPAPRPYSTGFNFSPIPGDDGPSNLVPARKIVPNYDPTGWAQLPVPKEAAEAPAAPAPLVSPQYELPSIVTEEWRGEDLSPRYAGSMEGGGAFKADESQPLVSKKRKGDPTPKKLKTIPHPSLTLGYAGPLTQMLSPVASSSTSSTPAEIDPNDPQGKFTEVSMDAPSSAFPYISSDPLLQPWSYTPAISPSQAPPKPKPAPPIVYPGAPRHPDIQLPAWSLRKAAHAKLSAESNPDGSTHWRPTRKLSQEKMHEMRQLASEDPGRYNMKTLSEMHDISPEAVRRILKSKWQEKDETEWEGLVGAGRPGDEKDDGRWMNALEVDAEEMVRSVKDGKGRLGVSREEENKNKNKISEDDPFGDIDEIDESEWKLAGGSQMEEEFERKQEEEERLDREAAAAAEGKDSSSSSSSVGSTSSTDPSSFTSAPPSTKRFKPLLKPGYGGKIFPPSKPTSPPPSSTIPLSTGRTKHDSRVSDPEPWIATNPNPTTTSLLTSLPSHPPSPTEPSPFAKRAAEAAEKLKKRKEWAEAREHSKHIDRQYRLDVFDKTKVEVPEAKRLPSVAFDGRRKEIPLPVPAHLQGEIGQAEPVQTLRGVSEGGGGKIDWARRAQEVERQTRRKWVKEAEEVWGRNQPRPEPEVDRGLRARPPGWRAEGRMEGAGGRETGYGLGR